MRQPTLCNPNNNFIASTFIMRLLLLPVLCLLPFCCSAQTLKKYNIGKSGCAAYFYCDPGKFDLSFSPDSSKVYTGECKASGATYDVICVEMKETIKELPLAENVLQEYMDYLKSSFQVNTSAGYGK